jgi:hypothetical protein
MENINENRSKLWNELESKGFTKLIGLSKDEYLHESADWERRDIPKEKEDEIKKDCLAYLEYITDVLSLKKKYDPEEAKRLHTNVTRWKPNDFPLRK